MADLTLWHNQRCSKSRSACELLTEAGVTFDERRYLEAPPTAEELDAVLTALGHGAVGPGPDGRDRGQGAGPARPWTHDRAAWIELLVANPILIERPILVTNDGRAVVGRPPESVLSLL